MPNTQFRWVRTIDDLKAETGMVNGEIAIVQGYYAAGDGGGGIFYFDSAVPTSAQIRSASNTNPITITTSDKHGIPNHSSVYIDGVGGNTNANGRFTAYNVTDTTFQLYGVAGSGAYTSGGVIGDGGTKVPSSAAAGWWRRLPQ
jgi:hypothetical protein